MTTFVNLNHGASHYGLHQLTQQSEKDGDTIFHLDLSRVAGFPHPTNRRRRRRSAEVGPIQRFLDPSREHPFLKSLMEAVGPLLQGFISTQLPMLLGSIMGDEDDE